MPSGLSRWVVAGYPPEIASNHEWRQTKTQEHVLKHWKWVT